MKKLLLTSVVALLMATSAYAQSKCPQCMGDGFPHPNYQQSVSVSRMQCIRIAVARYRNSTIALDDAVRACARYIR
jgi:hypothetical protein